jgi:hypothetical protein
MIPPLLDRLRLALALQELTTDVREINAEWLQSPWQVKVRYVDFWNWWVENASQTYVLIQFRTSSDFTATRVLIREKAGIKIGCPITYLAVLGNAPMYEQWV